MGRLEFVDWMAELGWMVAGLSVENMAGWRCRFGVGNMAEWLGRFGVENSAACCGFHVNISACCRLGVDDSTTCRLDSSSLDISTCNLGVDSPQNAAQRSRSQPASASTTAPAPPAGPAPAPISWFSDTAAPSGKGIEVTGLLVICLLHRAQRPFKGRSS